MSHHTTHFQTRKLNCLSKRDKSSAGRIDPRAVDICAALNQRKEYYTTSSCAGRCFLYSGDGIKSWHNSDNNGGNENAGVEDGEVIGDGTAAGKLGFFQRSRVNHDLIHEPQRYFDLTTLAGGQDPTGGGDPIPTIGQFDHGNNAGFKSKLEEFVPTSPIWLRFEPFILHVMCRSLKAASALMALARPAFKNVGLTSWNNGGGGDENDDNVIEDGGNSKNQQCKGGGPRFLVAIWGDEGLDMPLSLPSSPQSGLFYNPDDGGTAKNADWLAQLVNERHARNWKKIERFVEAFRSLDEEAVDMMEHNIDVDGVIHGIDEVELNVGDDNNEIGSGANGSQSKRAASGLPIPRSYDVVGDVAILNSLPEGDEDTQRKVGEWIMSRNKAMKICVARTNSLSTSDRSPGASGMVQIAGPPRNPIVTSHYEYGVKCVVDLQQTFFSPRMAPERLRLSQQIARGERVLVVFAGVGMEALQIAARTEAKEVLAIEMNAVAAECLRRARRMLERNKTATCPGGGKGAAERLSIIEGDALDILPTLESASYDRIVAPRPKEGTSDGDLGTGDAGKAFLLAMLPLLKLKGEVHWYDFAADHELPNCARTRETVQAVCESLGLEMEVIHVAKVGSIAKRQFRICMDFRITGRILPKVE
mmetsp:Transcript_24210/g.52212  ORF Transcript_24210/g.52212 Transcript_24210/m.52212 type:complete len:646 (-) Transcript_24210:65-2002(-)